MASSNVEYYQKQKDLQDKIHENERRRLQLEAQLQSYCRSDEKLAKLRAVKLQSYWKKICDDERRSKQRNAQLLRDLDRMENNMASLEARREKLRQLKQQYWDYIDRTYPHWMELVQQKQREQQQQQQLKEQQQRLQHQERIQQQQQQQQRLQQQQQEIIKQQQQQEKLQQQLLQQERLQQQERIQQQQMYQQQQMMVEEQQQLQQRRQQQEFGQQEEEDVPPPLPASPPPPLPFSSAYTDNYRVEPEREYTNLKDVSRQLPAGAPKQPPVASVTVHMPENPQGEFNTPVIQRRDTGGRKMEQPGQSWLGAERDPSVHSVSFSEEVSVPIIQPVQSVTVRQKQIEQKLPPTVPPDSQSDEDISDFGDDVELPSGEAMPPPLPEDNKPPSPSPPFPEQETAVKQVLVDSDNQDQEPESLSNVHPELSTQGLMRLLKYVEDDIADALSVEGYYRTRNPDTAQRKEIIYKANSLGSMQGLDAEYVSMVILEQLTPVIRSLPGACILPDTLLIRSGANTTESQIRSQLHRDAQGLWDKLLEHFICLVKNRAMGTREVAYVFVPCLAHDSSQHQDKAVTILEQVIEQVVSVVDTRAMSPIQDSIVDTARSSQQNGVVPPLKFGSLVDSKPFSDEESSMITQSMTTEGPKVPLNETEAYKSLVSGSMGAKRPPPTVMSDDTDDNSDNDLEKQFVSTLSPRSHASNIHPDHENEEPPEAVKLSEKVTLNESPDESPDQEPLSEVGNILGTSMVYVPTGVERRAVERSTARSGLGSTGGSSQQRKLAGMISSDIDTDTEVDIDKMGTKKSDLEDDDDFHDFYQ